MPLTLLVTIVVLGIAGIALLTHLTGQSARFVFDDDAVARDRWLREWPEDRVTATCLAPDGHAALVMTDQGPGIVWAFGADTVSRRIAGAALTPCKTGLRLDLHEFAAPATTIHLPGDEARSWLERIKREKPDGHDRLS